MKGIILAGGSGTRLFPVTQAVSKQLLPIGDKPLIYYPLSVLMLAGIREVVFVCNEPDVSSYRNLFGDGSKFGISIEYIVQPKPAGIAQAFLLAEDYIVGESVALILGDNLFYGYGFSELLSSTILDHSGATVFGYRVSDPERFGVIEFDSQGNVISIEEKPALPKSQYAVTGLYFYDHQVVDFAKELSPSERGELEITDINRRYLDKGQLTVKTLGRGFAWLDTGTHKAMADAGAFINAIEARQGVKVACLEEIAFSKGWMSIDSVRSRAQELSKSDYGLYLSRFVSEVSGN